MENALSWNKSVVECSNPLRQPGRLVLVVLVVVIPCDFDPVVHFKDQFHDLSHVCPVCISAHPLVESGGLELIPAAFGQYNLDKSPAQMLLENNVIRSCQWIPSLKHFHIKY